MDDGVDLIFAQGSLQDGSIHDVAANHADAIDCSRANQLGLWHRVAHQTDDGGTSIDQAGHQPRADESRSASHEHGPVQPEAVRPSVGGRSDSWYPAVLSAEH